MTLETLSENRSFGGTQGVYRHRSQSTGTDMTFAVFMPELVANERVPVLWYLSGLTCTHANVMEKGEYRRMAAELGLIIVCPDTSPRGDDVADADGYDQLLQRDSVPLTVEDALRLAAEADLDLVEVAPGELEAVRAIVEREMDGAIELLVPLEVSAGTGANWDAAAH